MRRRLLYGMVGLLAAAACAGPSNSFKVGIKALGEERYADAVEAFGRAVSDAPESAAPLYNLGVAHYRLGTFAEAAQCFQAAASLAESDPLRSRCWYNLGNCMVGSGEGLRESAPTAAAEAFRQAAWLYRAALDYDAGSTDAAYNLEVSLRLLAGIEESIRQERDKQRQENEFLRYLREKLEEFIGRQTRIGEVGNAGGEQHALMEETLALAEAMAATGLHEALPLPDGTTMPGPLGETYDHTVKAADAMGIPDPARALAELVAALGAAPEDPNRPSGESGEEQEGDAQDDMQPADPNQEANSYDDTEPFGEFSEYEELRGVPPPNKTERDILAEEAGNRERRKADKGGEYRNVEKDW